MIDDLAWEAERNAIYDAAISANGGAWPDMEGLIRDVYVAHLRCGDLALDVGVNHGGHLVQMAEAVGNSGKVVGIEAVPALVEKTHELIRDHYSHLSDRIQLYNVAVSDRHGSAKFFFARFNDSGLSGMAKRAVLDEGPVEEIDVTVETIDRLLAHEDISKLRFAKFDIEGAEFNAFRGAASVIPACPLLTFEWDSTAPEYFDYSPSEIFDFIRAKGYSVYDLFGFKYDDARAFTSARVWNFVAFAAGLDATEILKPSLTTLRLLYPSVFTSR